MNIRPATEADARFIAQGIVAAVGDEITNSLAAPTHTREDVIELFATLARMDNTQYSYLNSLIVEDDAGEPAGVAVAYDGARLHELRPQFFTALKEQIGHDYTAMEDECTPDEFYLDTLAVIPSRRGRGYAQALIEATAVRAREAGKPLGLLVEKENHKAQRLYEKCGFRFFEERPFAFILMDHLRMK
ncbi:MAG: GNAT family N-acetyltransferase [Muribaculaceae bacterium]|nr:GNAT family N-acetyltransferase [Muribaculaceae bacterium]